MVDNCILHTLQKMNKLRQFTFPFVMLTSLFFMWGLITVLVDSLIPRLREIFELSYFQSGLVQFAFFIAYGLVSIPAGKLLHRIGYKRGIVTGLIAMGVGCLLFYPAAAYREFGVFMAGYFILAAGMTVLQVAANPYVTVLGDPSKAASRLNLAQAFNSLGTAIAPAIGAVFILSDQIKSSEEILKLSVSEKEIYFSSEAAAVQQPFVFLALSLILLALITLRVPLPSIIDEASKGSYRAALKHKKLMFGALGIFVYVGAEVAVGSYLVNYFLSMDIDSSIAQSKLLSEWVFFIQNKELSVLDGKGIVGTFVVFYWSAAMLGRFIGAYLSKMIAPPLLLSVFAFGAILMLGITMTTQGNIAMFSILLVGLFNSIMFPTIFSIAIEDLGELKAEGSGILCTAIAGGAFIPPLYGLLTDHVSFKTAFFLIIGCYAYILFYGKITWRRA